MNIIGTLASAKIEPILDYLVRREFISRLMCDLAVDLDTVGAPSGEDWPGFQISIEALQPLVDEGLVQIEGRRIEVPNNARPILRTVCAAFDNYLEKGRGRYSRPV